MTSSSRAVENYAANLNHDLRGKRIAVLDNVQEAVADPAIRENFEMCIRDRCYAQCQNDTIHSDAYPVTG